jgi:outer membrane protein assembly factor BamB
MKGQLGFKLRLVSLIIILIVCLPLTILFGPIVTPYINQIVVPILSPYGWTPTVTDRDVVASPQFVPLWARSSLFMPPGEDIPLLMTDERVFLIASTTRSSSLSLLGLDRSDGQTIWTQPTGVGAEIRQNSRHLFLAEQGLVTAFNFYSGERIWRTRLPVPKMVHFVTTDDMNVNVDVAPTYFYVLDAATGEINQSATSSQSPSFFYSDHETLDFGVGLRSVWAEDKQSGKEIWRQTLNIDIVQLPLLSSNRLLVKEGHLALVYAFDTATGTLIWQSQEKAASNIAVDNSILYYLTLNGQLMAVNAETGQLLATLDFTPNTPLADPYERGYYVAAHNGMVAVYFGDSRELFLLHFTGTP